MALAARIPLILALGLTTRFRGIEATHEWCAISDEPHSLPVALDGVAIDDGQG